MFYDYEIFFKSVHLLNMKTISNFSLFVYFKLLIFKAYRSISTILFNTLSDKYDHICML